jgi:hypothetical protein
MQHFANFVFCVFRNLSNAKWPIITVVCLAVGLIAGSLFVAVQLAKSIQFKSWYELSGNENGLFYLTFTTPSQTNLQTLFTQFTI